MKNLSDTYCDNNSSAIFVPNTIINRTNILVNNKVPETKIIFQEGDEKLFEEIYTKYLPRIVSFAYGYLNNTQEAQNVAQDVFIAFWRSKDNVILQEKVLPYLIVITKNQCLNILKRNNRAKEYCIRSLDEKTTYLNTVALGNRGAMKIYETEVNTLINKAVSQMKPKIRETFLKSRVKGLKNREIAQNEGVAESTIEARIKIALLIMKKLLKDYL